MPINARSLKPKRRRAWVFFSLSLLFGLFLIASSLLPGEISSRQSALFSKALSDFLSLFSPGSEAKTMVEPTGLALLSDSTLLPMKNGLPQLAEGTTSLLSFRLDSPKLKQGEYLNPHFEVTRLEGGEEDYLLSLPRTRTRNTSISRPIAKAKRGSPIGSGLMRGTPPLTSMISR